MSRITPLPPPPSRNDPTTFRTRADALLGALPEFVEDANALADAVYEDRQHTAAIRNETSTIRDNAISETSAIKAAAVAETTAIRDDAIAQTTALKNAAVAARDGAEAARDIAAAAANFRGAWSSLSGALSVPASVHHAGRLWVLLTSVSDVTAHEPGVSAVWDRLQRGIDIYPYEQRGSLRSVTAVSGDTVIVEGLGLFAFYPGSDEPDDDESCYATSTGRWLLEAAHWDLVDAWQLHDDDVRDAVEMLHGTATCTITAVSAISSVSFTGDVPGAAMGDRVIATPPGPLGASATDSGRLSYHAYVSAPDTVTITLSNASAASASTHISIQTAWPVTVIRAL